MSDKIFFFGSGFSKSIINEYPTLYELSDYIKKIFKNDSSAMAKYYNNEIPKKFLDNIETLLSYLLIDLPYKKSDEKLIDRALYKNITNKIVAYFQELDNKYPISSEKRNVINKKSVNNFAKYILQNNCTCITLNYDVLLDNILYYTKDDEYITTNKLSTFYKIPIEHLSERGQGYFYSGLNFGPSGPRDFYKDMTPSIIKLHGSINWRYSEYVNNQIYYNDETLTKFQSVDLEPFIIPPVLDKSILYNNTILIALWRQAFEAIQKAKNIYIYGFSFPETDYSIKFLFQSALKDRSNYKIYVINTNNNLNDLKNKYNTIFNEKYCNYDCCVEDNQLEVLMNILKH